MYVYTTMHIRDITLGLCVSKEGSSLSLYVFCWAAGESLGGEVTHCPSWILLHLGANPLLADLSNRKYYNENLQES